MLDGFFEGCEGAMYCGNWGSIRRVKIESGHEYNEGGLVPNDKITIIFSCFMIQLLLMELTIIKLMA